MHKDGNSSPGEQGQDHFSRTLTDGGFWFQVLVQLVLQVTINKGG